jgi:hypothetical protein
MMQFFLKFIILSRSESYGYPIRSLPGESHPQKSMTVMGTKKHIFDD